MRPFIPYMGAKTSVGEHLAQICSSVPHATYIEMFVGSGSVFFAKDKAKINILNDRDQDVINIYQAVAADPKSVMAERQRLPVSRLLYDQIQGQMHSHCWFQLSEAERAARMTYVLSCAINSKLNSPFPASSTSRINYDADRDFQPYAQKLRGVTLECLDWAELIDRYVLQPRSISCMLYADPPYVVTTGRHYRYNFDGVDHLLLARKLALVNQRNGGDRRVRVVISYDDDPSGYIRSLYRREFGWHIDELPIQYRGGHHASATPELLITNFAKDTIEPIGHSPAECKSAD